MAIHDFEDGEILSEVELDDLQEQTVMRFDSVAARDAALTSPDAGTLAWTPETGVFMRYGSTWVPLPGTEIAMVAASAAQSIPNGTATAVNLPTNSYLPFGQVRTTNFDRFVLPYPGRYESVGHVSYASGAAGYRYAYVQLNAGTSIVGSHSAISESGGFTGADSTATFTANGTTDYIRLIAQQGSGGALNTASSGAATSTLRVKYLGPAY